MTCLTARYLAFVGLSTMLACGGNPEPSQVPPLSDQDRTALQKFADEDCRIVMSADWDALAAGYDEDAVRMPPNAPPIRGRTAIRNSLNQVPPITECNFRSEQLDGNTQLAFMRASYDMTISPSNGASIRDMGKILIVFRKQTDGTWLRVADAWNSDGAAR